MNWRKTRNAALFFVAGVVSAVVVAVVWPFVTAWYGYSETDSDDDLRLSGDE